MDPYRYLVFHQQGVVVLGVLQTACAGLCVVCGFIDAAFRKSNALSATRTPLWGGLISAVPGVLALLASQRKNPTLVSGMVVSAILSCVAMVMVFVYSCVTLSYGEEEEEVFIHHHSPDVTFVLHGMVKGANATILLAGSLSLLLCSLMAYAGCRSLPCCGCYDARTGLEILVPQTDLYTELCAWQGGDDVRLFNSPVGSAVDREEAPPTLPAYSRLT